MPSEIYNEGRVVGYSAYEMYVKRLLSVDPNATPATEQEWLAASLAMGSSLLLKVDHNQASDETFNIYRVYLPTNSRLLAANTIVASLFIGEGNADAQGWVRKVTQYGMGYVNTSQHNPTTDGVLNVTRYQDDTFLALLDNYIKILDGSVIMHSGWVNSESKPPEKDINDIHQGQAEIVFKTVGKLTQDFYILFTGFTDASILKGEINSSGSTNTSHPENGDFLGPQNFPWGSKIVFTTPTAVTLWLNNKIADLYNKYQDLLDKYNQLDRRVTSIEGDIVTIKSRLDDLTTRMISVENEITDINYRIVNEIIPAILAINQQITTINETISDIQTSITRIQNNIASIEEFLDTLYIPDGHTEVTVEKDASNPARDYSNYYHTLYFNQVPTSVSDNIVNTAPVDGAICQLLSTTYRNSSNIEVSRAIDRGTPEFPYLIKPASRAGDELPSNDQSFIMPRPDAVPVVEFTPNYDSTFIETYDIPFSGVKPWMTRYNVRCLGKTTARLTYGGSEYLGSSESLPMADGTTISSSKIRGANSSGGGHVVICNAPTICPWTVSNTDAQLSANVSNADYEIVTRNGSYSLGSLYPGQILISANNTEWVYCPYPNDSSAPSGAWSGSKLTVENSQYPLKYRLYKMSDLASYRNGSLCFTYTDQMFKCVDTGDGKWWINLDANSNLTTDTSTVPPIYYKLQHVGLLDVDGIRIAEEPNYRVIGDSTTAITDEGTQSPTINRKIVQTSSLRTNDVVRYNKVCYIWQDSAWHLAKCDGVRIYVWIPKEFRHIMCEYRWTIHWYIPPSRGVN